MKLFLSPAKRLDVSPNPDWPRATNPSFGNEAEKVMNELKSLNAKQLQELMGISKDLAQENVVRYAEWSAKTRKHGLYAAHMFDGEVYRGLKESEISANGWKYLQKNMFILSGLYGVLRPLDKVMPYRLEMGTQLPVGDSKNLYEFWGESLTDFINEKSRKNEVLLNLSSQEYMKVLHKDKLHGKLTDVKFLDMHQGKLKQITVYFKKARGAMVNYCARNAAKTLEDVKAFDDMGYAYNDNLSEDNLLVFTR
ncbi:MAG: peroxide stress protein YaaA [Weeksellaceae bacterium]|nr:peroxide stress protein YaaA [Weeksellaceae bacterium]